ncbi:MAG TPA: ABC transporter permease [Thermoanaerobaculia bacterium]|nr:ABC transporter permease [Thermoanaerobaculia bacterium]
MTETVYSAQAELRHPARFLGDALRDLRQSPSVAWRLFRGNVQARYRRAWLGYLWLLLPTLGMTAVWVFMQSRRIIAVAPTALPYVVHVLCGTILCQVFVESLNAPLQQLTISRQLVTRSRVPHEAMILAGVYEVLLNTAVRLAVLAVALFAYAIPLAPGALLFPLGIAALMVLGLAIGIFLAPFGMLYEDVGRGVMLVTTFWFFLTPVIYPAPASGPLRLNPVTPLLDTTRAWLTAPAAPWGFVAVALVATVVLGGAWLLERLARPHVVARFG